jgi:hypothetical protein
VPEHRRRPVAQDKPGLLHPQAEVHVLEPSWVKAGIKPKERLPPESERRRGRLLDRGSGLGLVFLGHPHERERLEEEPPGGRETAELPSRLGLAAGSDQLRRQAGSIWEGFEAFQQPVEGAFLGNGIGVQDQQDRSPCLGSSRVRSAAEAEVALRPDEARRPQLQGAGRAVVHHDQLEARIARPGGGEPGEKLLVAPVDDDARELGRRHGGRGYQVPRTYKASW